jgi:hypothetical protein
MQRGFAEIQQFELNERRTATHSTRMQQLDSIWSIASEIRVSREALQPDPVVQAAWSKLRKAIDERDRAVTK